MGRSISDLVDNSAEGSVIASLIYHPEYLLSDNNLQPRFFWNQENQLLYWGINELVSSGVTKIDSLNLHNILYSKPGTQKIADKYGLVNLQEYIEMASKLENENKELKKQIIEWHDPNDFPKRNGNVVQNQDGDKVTYDYRLKHWRWTDGGTDGLKMIAWCEIPKLGE